MSLGRDMLYVVVIFHFSAMVFIEISCVVFFK